MNNIFLLRDIDTLNENRKVALFLFERSHELFVDEIVNIKNNISMCCLFETELIVSFQSHF